MRQQFAQQGCRLDEGHGENGLVCGRGKGVAGEV